MTGLRLVVFDIDGTLVDSAGMILAGFSRAFDDAGLAMPGRAEVLAVVGLSLDEAMARLMPRQSEDAVARAAKVYRTAYFNMRREGGAAAVALFPGAKGAIETLAARDEVLIGAATGMAWRGLDHVLDVHGLAPHFVTRQTADTNPSKPHPAMLQAALKEAGVEASHAVMVGDTTYDIEMAVAAGVPAIGVNWGHHGPELLQAAGAARVIGTFEELIPALDEIWRQA